MVLLDRSAAIRVLRGGEPPASVAGESFGISTVVELEIQLGVFHGGGNKERRRVDQFLAEAVIFPFEHKAAMETARVMAGLWRAGEPIGDFDSQIAGHALALELPLLTDNVRHFQRVKKLLVIPWSGEQT